MISIIIPFYNEAGNLEALYHEINDVLMKEKSEAEIIFVNDGSTDGSEKEIEKIINSDNRVKCFYQQRRLGKGKALDCGIKESRGDIVIFMDADLQDNPKDIPKIINKLNEGYDLVNGIRTTRKENPVIKLYSRLANKLLKKFSQSPFTDINCGFKVFRRQVLDGIALYGNNFRFLPLAAYYAGFKVTEVEVDNRPRKYGQSKFGLGKPAIGIIDMTTAYFLYKFSEKPLHFFGAIGGIFFVAGFIIALVLSIERIFFGLLLYRRPILLLAILLIIVGIQIVMTGIIGELVVYLNKKKLP